jgi:hypothetical protein
MSASDLALLSQILVPAGLASILLASMILTTPPGRRNYRPAPVRRREPEQRRPNDAE